MSHVHTRSHNVGRIPSLRDRILMYLQTQSEPRTAKEIAEAIEVHKTTPYRPLEALVKLNIVDVHTGIDGAEYIINNKYLEYFTSHPRRIKD